MSYEQKYLKYKTKYFNLLEGGREPVKIKKLDNGAAIKVYDEKYESLEEVIRKLFDELRDTIKVITESIKCCRNDFEHVKTILNELDTYCKQNNKNLYDYLDVSTNPQIGKSGDDEYVDGTQAAAEIGIDTAKESKAKLSKKDKQFIASNALEFIGKVLPLFDKTIQIFDTNVNNVSLSVRTNNIPVDKTYDYFSRYYMIPVLAICNTCLKLSEQLTDLFTGPFAKLPYIKLHMLKRDETCDQSINFDCLLMLFGQKLTRIVMPIVQMKDKLSSEQYDLGQYANELKVLSSVTLNILHDINHNVYKLDEHNFKLFGTRYVIISMKNIDMVHDLVDCDMCVKDKNKRECCKLKACQIVIPACTTISQPNKRNSVLLTPAQLPSQPVNLATPVVAVGGHKKYALVSPSQHHY